MIECGCVYLDIINGLRLPKGGHETSNVHDDSRACCMHTPARQHIQTSILVSVDWEELKMSLTLP